MVARFVRFNLAADVLLYAFVALSIVAFVWYGVVLLRRLGEEAKNL